MRCAFTADFLTPSGDLVYKDIGLGRLDDAGVAHAFFAAHEPEVRPAQLAGFDAVVSLTPRITTASLADVECLAAVVRFGVGYDMVDVDACTRADVALFITRGAVNHSVAEATIAWMLALSHRVPQKDRLVREGRWAERPHFMGGELRGRTLGLIGAGGIGSTLVGLLAGFRMAPPLAFDPYLSDARAAAIGVTKVPLEELLGRADFVSVNCPLTGETRGLIGTAELARMKPTAFLINTARGGIVDDAALAGALQAGTIAGAASDVFSNEPAGQENPLSSAPNSLLAPHCIAWTDELFTEIGHMAAGAVIELASGRAPDGLLVNGEVLVRPGFQKKLARLAGRP